MSNKLQFMGQVSGAAAKGPLVQRGLSKVAVVPLLTGGLSFFTIPPTKIKDFGHLPLHKGGSRLRRSTYSTNSNL